MNFGSLFPPLCSGWQSSEFSETWIANLKIHLIVIKKTLTKLPQISCANLNKGSYFKLEIRFNFSQNKSCANLKNGLQNADGTSRISRSKIKKVPVGGNFKIHDQLPNFTPKFQNHKKVVESS